MKYDSITCIKKTIKKFVKTKKLTVEREKV